MLVLVAARWLISFAPPLLVAPPLRTLAPNLRAKWPHCSWSLASSLALAPPPSLDCFTSKRTSTGHSQWVFNHLPTIFQPFRPRGAPHSLACTVQPVLAGNFLPKSPTVQSELLPQQLASSRLTLSAMETLALEGLVSDNRLYVHYEDPPDLRHVWGPRGTSASWACCLAALVG